LAGVEAGIKTIAAVHSQCRSWVIIGQQNIENITLRDYAYRTRSFGLTDIVCRRVGRLLLLRGLI
jgi:hypothetical protein